MENIERRMDARKEYYKILHNIAEWLIGLTMGELGLIAGLRLNCNKDLFIPMLLFSMLSIVLALTIMYFEMTYVDAMMYTAHLRTFNETIDKEEYEKAITKRIGLIGNFIINFVMKYKIYNFLFLSFLCGTILTVILIVF